MCACKLELVHFSWSYTFCSSAQCIFVGQCSLKMVCDEPSEFAPLTLQAYEVVCVNEQGQIMSRVQCGTHEIICMGCGNSSKFTLERQPGVQKFGTVNMCADCLSFTDSTASAPAKSIGKRSGRPRARPKARPPANQRQRARSRTLKKKPAGSKHGEVHDEEVQARFEQGQAHEHGSAFAHAGQGQH